MAQVELIMPKMGESIIEATILRWAKNVGDRVEADETILEIATDKVDSEVPSPSAGVIAEIFFKENDVVPVGKAIAIIATEGETVAPKPSPAVKETAAAAPASNGHSNGSAASTLHAAPQQPAMAEAMTSTTAQGPAIEGRFYSPLVKNIAKAENISTAELERIPGSGQAGRVTKQDILAYVENRSSVGSPTPTPVTSHESPITKPAVSISGNVEIVEMDRMRKLIADHMVMSKHTSPHVTSFVEVDVTNLFNWRERNKSVFQKKYGEKITFTPIFVEAVAKAIGDFPMINISVDGNRIIVKKDINIGMATALPSGNLIVPVIKNANMMNLVGLTKSVNDLAGRARIGKLKPEEVQDGTFTLTNVGTFGNVMGTPIINQPQVAIMAVGAIRKKPAVVETEYGDLIAVRQMMFLSMSYDHRVVDGSLGGSFIRRVGDYLEQFDGKREV
ncbi:MAG: 2-oxo acid dehydrogenase subunit E2 [Saprospiraceae bacterium]|nr:2-oxo acid dehydrogenase subunit E2 [Saprospiraceae bacterium]MCF8250860.1 2-oxo acid dehydrogenase subunit E2 [Saprospiraceae bacterium]MCF8280681.1 2-oxo acid dehydrogenase subunit E2 [Bacteroidales bacterium]MCF8312739.1 2-oxo acid dehydrogenase subunit E2 [Saprospiraceae bacterium]MCF8441186.1 2-oxo acid dehydrogenase subunit E2 [Saprospiraceae bacterium]